MKKNVNLDKLKEEISSRHKQKNQTHNSEGAPKDKFLYGLLSSLKTGQMNESTNLIKRVDNQTSLKSGEKPKLSVNENIPTKPQPRKDTYNQQPIDMSPERDEELYRKFEASKNKTLAESIQGYYSQSGAPQQQYSQHPQHNAPMLNEEHLMGAVKGTVDKYLTE
ncbi:MAG: hypothetical protein ACOC22_02360, partial [bacterium]